MARNSLIFSNFMPIFAVLLPKKNFIDLRSMARKKHNDLMTVLVKVHPALREYLVSINNSETIVPERGTQLWGLVSMYLECTPPDSHPVPEGDTPADSIRIAIFNSHSRTWCAELDRSIFQDTIFRNYLSPKSQRVIARHLMADFKHTFRAYMTGAINNNPDISITEAIDEFCEDYHITMQQLTLDLLRKDWYRWRVSSSESSKAPSSWSNNGDSEH